MPGTSSRLQDPFIGINWLFIQCCKCMCVCVHDNSENNGSINLKLEYVAEYENGLSSTLVIVQSKVTARL